jgi:hypothetical protein
MIALPSVSGANPDCPVTAFPAFSPPSTSPLPCIFFYGVWGAGYLILWTVATLLAKSKMMEMEKVPQTGKGVFDDPFDGYTYETSVKDSPYPGIGEIIVSVKADKEEVKLNEFVFRKENSS